MASTKVTALALLLLLQCHWIQSQYTPYGGGYGGCGCGGYGYGYPPIAYDNDNDLDILLPILLIALCKNGGLGRNDPYPYQQCGGCGGCCNCCCCCCG